MSWWAATETGELKREVFHFLSISRDIFKVWFTPLMIYCLGLLVTSPLKLTWEIRERNNTFKAQRGWRPSQPHTFLHFYISTAASPAANVFILLIRFLFLGHCGKKTYKNVIKWCIYFGQTFAAWHKPVCDFIITCVWRQTAPICRESVNLLSTHDAGIQCWFNQPRFENECSDFHGRQLKNRKWA